MEATLNLLQARRCAVSNRFALSFRLSATLLLLRCSSDQNFISAAPNDYASLDDVIATAPLLAVVGENASGANELLIMDLNGDEVAGQEYVLYGYSTDYAFAITDGYPHIMQVFQNQYILLAAPAGNHTPASLWVVDFENNQIMTPIELDFPSGQEWIGFSVLDDAIYAVTLDGHDWFTTYSVDLTGNMQQIARQHISGPNREFDDNMIAVVGTRQPYISLMRVKDAVDSIPTNGFYFMDTSANAPSWQSYTSGYEDTDMYGYPGYYYPDDGIFGYAISASDGYAETLLCGDRSITMQDKALGYIRVDPVFNEAGACIMSGGLNENTGGSNMTHRDYVIRLYASDAYMELNGFNTTDGQQQPMLTSGDAVLIYK